MVRNVEREESHLPAEADDSMIHSSQDHMSRMSDQSRDFQRSKSEKDFIAEATGPSGETLAVVPQWNIRVHGRKFGKYVSIASKKPRRTLVGLPVIDPTSRLASFWAYVNTITDMTYTSFIVPLSMAFNDYTKVNTWTILDLIGSGVFVLDIFMEFHIGFMVRWDTENVTILDGLEVAKFYVLEGSFVVDFLASIPVILQIMFIADSTYGSNSSAVRLLQLLRLLRLLRVINLIVRMGQVSQGGSMSYYFASKFSTLSLFILRIAFTVSVLVNLMACLWWWVAVTQGLDNSWVAPVEEAKPQLDLYSTNNVVRWLVSAYYVLCTISTIGYGDITPVTVAEIGMACIFILTGVAYFGYVISSISELLAMSKSSTIDGGQLLEKLRGMEGWMRTNGFGKKVRQELRRYYYTSWTPQEADTGAEYFDELPLWLRTKVLKSIMGNSEALEHFTGIKLHPLSRIAKRVIRAIAASAVPVHLRSGDRIFSAGDESKYVFLLEEGETGSIIEGDSSPYRVLSPGVLGASALFAEKISFCAHLPVSAFALTPCSLWRIDAKDLYRRLLSTAPISLVHILDGYLHGVEEFRAYFQSRIDEGYFIDSSSFTGQYESIVSEGSILRETLKDASMRHFAKDIESGAIEENDVDHKSFYHILNNADDTDSSDSDSEGIDIQDNMYRTFSDTVEKTRQSCYGVMSKVPCMDMMFKQKRRQTRAMDRTNTNRRLL